jgi:signal peptidase I
LHPLSEQNQGADQGRESPWAFWRSVAITLVVALGIRQFLVEARYIPSGSMLPGLQIQDRLLVEKLTYRRRAPLRGRSWSSTRPITLIRCWPAARPATPSAVCW